MYLSYRFEVIHHARVGAELARNDLDAALALVEHLQIRMRHRHLLGIRTEEWNIVNLLLTEVGQRLRKFVGKVMELWHKEECGEGYSNEAYAAYTLKMKIDAEAPLSPPVSLCEFTHDRCYSTHFANRESPNPLMRLL